MRIKKSSVIYQLVLILVVAAVLLWFFTALDNISRGQEQQEFEQLESALRRAAVSCYASEGIYPPSLDYLSEHYGIQIDTERYYVSYNIFADNLMPDITVVKIS